MGHGSQVLTHDPFDQWPTDLLSDLGCRQHETSVRSNGTNFMSIWSWQL